MSRSAEIFVSIKRLESRYYLRSNVDFVLLIFLVFLVASDQEGVGSRLLEQVELHLKNKKN